MPAKRCGGVMLDDVLREDDDALDDAVREDDVREEPDRPVRFLPLRVRGVCSFLPSMASTASALLFK